MKFLAVPCDRHDCRPSVSGETGRSGRSAFFLNLGSPAKTTGSGSGRASTWCTLICIGETSGQFALTGLTSITSVPGDRP